MNIILSIRFITAVKLTGLAIVLAGGMICGSVRKAHSEDLAGALVSAYDTHPRLAAERARLRATDEDVTRAKSALRPKASVSAQYGRQYSEQGGSSASSGHFNPSGYQITAAQPIFTGFTATNAILEAENNVYAGQERLRATEGEILLSAVTAYCDVIRDRSIHDSRKRMTVILAKTLASVKSRVTLRETTVTDLEQVRSRAARADADYDLASANLQASLALYRRTIGHPAGTLLPAEPPLRRLPVSEKEALAIAQTENPIISQARFLEAASRHTVDKVRGELLPQISVEANYGQAFEPSLFADNSEQANVMGRVSMPLYEGGEVYARVRQSKSIQHSRAMDIEDTAAEVETRIAAAWARLASANRQLTSNEVQLTAARKALQGVREEEAVGQRSVIDVLNAEQELVEAQVRLAETKRDIVVAAYAVLAETGQLNASQLGTSASIYDPNEHFNAVRDKWIGITSVEFERDGWASASPAIKTESTATFTDQPWKATTSSHEDWTPVLVQDMSGSARTEHDIHGPSAVSKTEEQTVSDIFAGHFSR